MNETQSQGLWDNSSETELPLTQNRRLSLFESESQMNNMYLIFSCTWESVTGCKVLVSTHDNKKANALVNEVSKKGNNYCCISWISVARKDSNHRGEKITFNLLLIYWPFFFFLAPRKTQTHIKMPGTWTAYSTCETVTHLLLKVTHGHPETHALQLKIPG